MNVLRSTVLCLGLVCVFLSVGCETEVGLWKSYFKENDYNKKLVILEKIEAKNPNATCPAGIDLGDGDGRVTKGGTPVSEMKEAVKHLVETSRESKAITEALRDK